MDYRTAYVINHFTKPRKPQEYYDRRTAKFAPTVLSEIQRLPIHKEYSFR